MIAETTHGSLTFCSIEPGSGLNSALERPPADALGRIEAAGLRGRGGAGFPTSLKWDLDFYVIIWNHNTSKFDS